MVTQHTGGAARLSRIAAAALVVATVAGVLTAVAGLGHRWGWWGFPTGFQVLRWGAYAGVAGIILGLTGLMLTLIRRRSRGASLAVIAMLISVTAVAIPLQQLRLARSVPPIHDITTDTKSPPQFEAILPLRHDASNPSKYGGPDIARQQRAAYPEVQPLSVAQPRAEVFRTALAIARERGWDIVATEADRGRIEAVATTFWFGFKDDVVIRLTSQGDATRTDMRSLSRVGRSDVGANARRIREFLSALEARLTAGG